jgi:hypothetical protein
MIAFMESLIYFFDQPDPRRIADALAAVYSIPRGDIGVIMDDRALPGTPDRPLALITLNPETEVESTVLVTGDRFAKLAGVNSALEIALDVCRAVGTNAVIGEDGLPTDHWILVTAVGGHGEVAVDPDESDDGRIKIIGLREPIEGAPTMPLI